MVEISERYVVLDIETWCPKGTPDPEVDELRYIGFRNFKGKNVCYHYTEREQIQRVLNYFPYIIGHNIKDYDIPVLERAGFNIPGTTIVIDTYVITDNRLKSMMYLDLNQGDRSLKKLCERFNLEHKKGEFDYSLLQKDKLEGEEYQQLEDYLFGDLMSCDDLFKYYYDFFYGFREYMDVNNQRKLSWLTCRPGATAYKCICNIAGLPEEYDDFTNESDDMFEGAFVAEPYKDFDSGDLYVADFQSLYPNLMFGFNLYSPVISSDKEYWKGSDIYPSVYGNDIDGIKGKYSREQGNIEKTIKQLFYKRLDVTAQLKQSDLKSDEKSKLEKERLAIKILINTCYGLLGSPMFKSVYNETAASDCTAMGRRSIKHARTMLEENGYECLYTDTDSVYFKDPFGSEYKVKETLQRISEIQRNAMNIPSETHQFVLESKIKHIYFFKDDSNNYVKKQYIYVTDDNKVKAKGIRIVRGDCSPIAKTVYEKYIKPLALEGKSLKLSIEQITNWLKDEIKLNPEQLKKRYRLKPLDQYKIAEGKDESSALHAQLSKRYGAGEHYFVVNKRIGPGKGNHYCTLEELKEKYGDQWVDQIKLDMYLNDLKCFVCDEERKKIK
jgi:DNA polymerase elongation subunit (family B)